jgi:hypothetical protein
LDDIRDILHPKILQNKKELGYLYDIILKDDQNGTRNFFEKLEGLESWEADQHCVRSMTFKKNKNKELDHVVIPKAIDKPFISKPELVHEQLEIN